MPRGFLSLNWQVSGYCRNQSTMIDRLRDAPFVVALFETVDVTTGDDQVVAAAVLVLDEVIGLKVRFASRRSRRRATVNPGTVDTPMIDNDTILGAFMPELEHPTRDDAAKPDSGFVRINALSMSMFPSKCWVRGMADSISLATSMKPSAGCSP
jgi:hypothetical protein